MAINSKEKSIDLKNGMMALSRTSFLPFRMFAGTARDIETNACKVAKRRL
jgi:hypothetical protein